MEFLPTASVVQPNPSEVPINITLRSFSKITCCKEMVFNIFAQCFRNNIALKICIERLVKWIVVRFIKSIFIAPWCFSLLFCLSFFVKRTSQQRTIRPIYWIKIYNLQRYKFFIVFYSYKRLQNVPQPTSSQNKLDCYYRDTPAFYATVSLFYFTLKLSRSVRSDSFFMFYFWDFFV